MSPCDLETSVSVCVVCVHLCVVVYVCVGKQGLTNGVVLERQKSFVQLLFSSLPLTAVKDVYAACASLTLPSSHSSS